MLIATHPDVVRLAQRLGEGAPVAWPCDASDVPGGALDGVVIGDDPDAPRSGRLALIPDVWLEALSQWFAELLEFNEVDDFERPGWHAHFEFVQGTLASPLLSTGELIDELVVCGPVSDSLR